MQSNKLNDPTEIPRLLTENLDRNLCVCYDVPKKEIINAFKGGARTFEAISNQTYACQGSGCCERQLERLIEVLCEQEAADGCATSETDQA
ncbi:MAG: (2Fe-2S)-binding protein [Pseudomonadota bacterium]|nr:(2Fe-2S)-binding protein [Pseudomonadota bacterium]